MRKIVRGAALASLLVLLAAPLPAQQSGLTTLCALAPPPTLDPAEYRRICYAAAQSLVSVHPQIGMLAASGNPVLGSASPAALRIGRQLRVDGTVRFGLASVRSPNLLALRPRPTSSDVTESISIDARALSADLAFGVLPGRTLSPALVGVGSLDLLGRAVWLPLRSFQARGFQNNAAAAGVGARVGVLREGFGTPGVSVSLMHHWMSSARLGNVCPGAAGGALPATCPGIGHSGEATFDYSGWSGRALVGRRFGGIGALVGGGYDRFGGSGSYRVRAPAATPGGEDAVVQSGAQPLRESRWSAFANASQTRVLTTFAIEAGWMQGTAPLPGYERTTGSFDPGRGTLFGSIGARVAF